MVQSTRPSKVVRNIKYDTETGWMFRFATRMEGFDMPLDSNCPPDAHRPNSDLQYFDDPNLQSLIKLIEFVLSRKYAKGWDDLSRRLRMSLKTAKLSNRLASLIPFGDPAFINVVLKIRSGFFNFIAPLKKD